MWHNQVVAERIRVLNKVGVALPFLVTLAEDNKEVPSEEVRLRLFSPFAVHVLFQRTSGKFLPSMMRQFA